jgi:hypothetical protein
MNPYDPLIAAIKNAVATTPTLKSTFTGKGWLDVGIPSANGPWPCIRVDGLVCLDDKLNRYSVNNKLFSKDLTYKFYDLAETLRAALIADATIMAGAYIDRPETGLSCVLFPVSFAV